MVTCYANSRNFVEWLDSQMRQSIDMSGHSALIVQRDFIRVATPAVDPWDSNVKMVLFTYNFRVRQQSVDPMPYDLVSFFDKYDFRVWNGYDYREKLNYSDLVYEQHWQFLGRGVAYEILHWLNYRMAGRNDLIQSSLEGKPVHGVEYKKGGLLSGWSWYYNGRPIRIEDAITIMIKNLPNGVKGHFFCHEYTQGGSPDSVIMSMLR